MVAVVGFGGERGGADLVVELCGGAVLREGRGGRGGGRGRLGSEHICYKFRSNVTVGTLTIAPGVLSLFANFACSVFSSPISSFFPQLFPSVDIVRSVEKNAELVNLKAAAAERCVEETKNELVWRGKVDSNIT